MSQRNTFPDVCASGCYMPHLCAGTASECRMKAKRYYPIFADLNGRSCVVIGGGTVAQRKVTTLLRYGAQLTVISLTLTRRLAAYAKRGRIRYLARQFRPGDLQGAWLVYAATDDPDINALVHREADRRRIFTNVVDQTPLCSFIAPSICQRGPLTIAVSTGGASPTLAKRLRRELQQGIGSEYAPMVRLLMSLRGIAKRELPSYQDRKRYFNRLVQGEVFALVRRGQAARARRRALTLLQQAAHRNGTHA